MALRPRQALRLRLLTQLQWALGLGLGWFPIKHLYSDPWVRSLLCQGQGKWFFGVRRVCADVGVGSGALVMKGGFGGSIYPQASGGFEIGLFSHYRLAGFEGVGSHTLLY